MKLKKLSFALLMASALAGCASFPDHYDKPLQVGDIAKEKNDEWNSTPAVVFRQSNSGIVVRKYNEIPKAVREKRVELSFTGGSQVTLGDLLFALNAQGFRLVSRLTDDTLKKPYMVKSFDGTLGDVLDDIGADFNVALEYRNNIVYLVESNHFSASLPKNKDFLEAAAKALKEMGATDTRADIMSGMVYYSAKPDVAGYLDDYLTAIAKNAAMVKFQVAVMTVTMNREVSIGFDWTKFAVMHGNGGMSNQLGSIFNQSNSSSNGLSSGGSLSTSQATTTTGTTGTTTGTTGTTTTGTTGTTGTTSTAGTVASTVAGAVATTATQLVTGSLAGFNGASGFGAQFASNAFSLNAALNALSTYGNARTDQNVIFSTISGVPMKINSGDDIPYTKSVGSATASGGATTGSAQTDVIKSGLEIDATPNFDSSDGTLTVQIKVKMATLVGYRTLSAGQNLGTMSYPQMKNLGFENFGRLTAGDTVIMGGITYDQLSNDYTNFPGMENLPLGSKDQKVDRNAIYIVVRPTVEIYVPNADEMNARLRALEEKNAALDAAAENAGMPGKSAKGPKGAAKAEVRS